MRPNTSLPENFARLGGFDDMVLTCPNYLLQPFLIPYRAKQFHGVEEIGSSTHKSVLRATQHIAGTESV